MITWLFTQVWLWSLAAFALGALITWLLFVRPLRRQLAELTAGYPEGEYVYEQQDEPVAAEAPLDLLRPAPPRWERPDDPEVGDWGRAPRAWVAPEKSGPERSDSDSEWFRQWDERVNGVDQADAAVTAVQPRVPPAEEPRPVEPRTVESKPAEPKPEDPEADEPTASVKPVEPPAEAPAEPAAAERKATPEEPATDISAWPEAEPTESRITGRLEDADDATESRLSGQLRSLFENVEPRSGAAAETPYVPPVGADATQVIPKVADRGPESADSAEGSAEPPPLPRRTPGAGPRPGREGGSGPMIKGHSASRQYHSPESPAYDKIVADVWFRTPADAEIAGFVPWNGQRTT
ncbi:LapA family protein [Saccharopolyspora elongata]|uniref:LapA family protein n=1 Tax=Saccharopolyspora elongata TaxID=2530387 RepID=UPI001F29D990|nr:LapA family protein [Saccharopolyspora elongata]